MSTPGAAAARTPIYGTNMIFTGVAVDPAGNAFISAHKNMTVQEIYKVSAAQLAGADYGVDLDQETPFLPAGSIAGHFGFSNKLTFHDGYLYVGSTDATGLSDWFRVDPLTAATSLYADDGGNPEIAFADNGQAYSVSWAETNTYDGKVFNTTAPGAGTFVELAGGLRTPYSIATATFVPEIDPAGMGSVLALVTGALGLLERRRLKAKLAA